MPMKPASATTLDSVSQCLFKNIELENALQLGLGNANVKPPQDSARNFDPKELWGAIFKTLKLLEHQMCERVARICDRHHSLLPIQRLPPEILSTCIAYAMFEIDTYNHQQRLTHLSTVSRWWRTVILGTPSLWGVISSKDPERIISLALSRSKGAPLMVMTDDIPNCNTLYGPGLKYKPSIRPDNLFKLVGEHSARWRKATLLGVNRSSCANGIQLSQHLQYLVLSGLGSPTADAGITPFSGRTENLLHLKLQNLVVSPKHLIQILASSHRMTSLDLQSLVAPTKEEPPDDPDGGASPAVDLQYLTSLKLKSLPKSILYPTVQNMGTSTLQTAHITHDETVQGNRFPDRSESQFDPFASFIARMATVEPWCFIELHSNKVIVKRPSSKSTCQYIIEILGQHPILLPWLSFVSLPQLPKSSLVQLYLGSDALGEIPGPGVMEALEQFPKLASVCLRGRKESWRWMWLLSLPDAVKRGTSSSDKVVGFWLWPGLRYLNIYGDFVDEFTVLSVLLERHKLTTSRGSSTDNRTVPRQLFGLEVRPGEKEWRAEVVDKIRELLKPGYLKCLKPN